MEISEVRIKLVEEAGDRLRAFCSITFDDCFVVRDLKIIEGTNGPFVAMPSRKLTARCHHCGAKNHLRAPFCNQCGSRQRDDRAVKDATGRTKLYADIAHPINSRCREMIQDRIIRAFHEELEKSKLPGYVSNYDEFDAGEDFEYHDDYLPTPTRPQFAPPVEAAPAPRQAEQTRVQAAEPAPPGPHRVVPQTGPGRPAPGRGGPHQRIPTPAPRPDRPSSSSDPPPGGFGAGIL